uniref:hypothetical protein n=1 Tax=Acinetobacter pittii TaxID=48296 RepID=UPI001E2DE9B9|nr:hypothetical protein [Acinetobacter pittii]
MKNFTQNEKGQMFYEGSLVLTAKDGSVFFVSTEMLVCKAYRAKAKNHLSILTTEQLSV